MTTDNESQDATTSPLYSNRREYRTAKLDNWKFFRLPTKTVQVSKLVSLDRETRKRRHANYVSQTTERQVPVLGESVEGPDGKFSWKRHPSRAERRNMWREALRS